jgi:hypothetical protein
MSKIRYDAGSGEGINTCDADDLAHPVSKIRGMSKIPITLLGNEQTSVQPMEVQ